jgi:cytoskeletal protein RodZ
MKTTILISLLFVLILLTNSCFSGVPQEQTNKIAEPATTQSQVPSQTTVPKPQSTTTQTTPTQSQVPSRTTPTQSQEPTQTTTAIKVVKVYGTPT